MMRTIVLQLSVAVCLLFTISVASAQQKSPKGDILVNEERLDDGGPKSSDTRRIWLVSAADPTKRELLFTHYRTADVVFSPDEEWLVSNHHAGSSEAYALLYRRNGGLHYEMTTDVGEAAWAFFCKQNGLGSDTGFDHNYVDCVQWLRGRPGTFLLTLRGHADSRNYTSDWRCIYDTKTREFLLTKGLKEHNKGRAVME